MKNKIIIKSISCPNCDEPMKPGGVCENKNCKYSDPANDSKNSSLNKKK